LDLHAILKRFDRGIVTILLIMMMIVVALATVELGWIIIKDVMTEPVFFLEIDELLEVFGFFLLVLIGLELVDTMRTYLEEGVIRVEVVVEIAMIAVARKVIILDIKNLPSGTIIGIAAIIIALSAAFFALRGWRLGQKKE